MSEEITLNGGSAGGDGRWTVRCPRRISSVLCVAAVLVTVVALGAAQASAAAPGVAWSLHSLARPTSFQSTDIEDRYTLSLLNTGSVDSSGTITVTDTLPAGVTTSGTPEGVGIGNAGGVPNHWDCTPGAGNSTVTCISEASVPALTPAETIDVPVSAAPGAAGTNEVEVSGGGAPECGGAGQPACASGSSPTTLGSQAPSFGLVDFTASALDAGGAVYTQAGGHPAGLTTSFDFATANTLDENGDKDIESVEQVKQVVVDLPAGLIGNPQAAPACTLSDLSATGFDLAGHECAAAAQVGTLQLISAPHNGGTATTQIFNVVPEHGYPAEFGVFEPRFQRPVLLYASVRGGSDYGIRVTSQNLPNFIPQTGISLAFFGNPARHDKSPTTPLAFFSNPTECSGQPLTVTVHADSWEHPGRLNADGAPDFSDPNWKSATTNAPPVTGCESLRFDPSISLMPETSQAGAPSGYTFDLGIPQNSQPDGLATPHLKNTTVTLPEGVAVSPSAADGLAGCSDEQIALSSGAPGSCPLASQIGTVQITTPLLTSPLVGQVFLGTPGCGPCSDADAQSGRMLRLFIQAQGSGVVVKLAGTVSADPATGRLTATFRETPQLPFSDLKLQFKGGPRAPLANPTSCGAFTTQSDLTPWSSPLTIDGSPSASFETTGCGNPGQFAPAFLAGTISPQAGGFSPLSVSFSRSDQDEDLSGVTVKTPPGLLGLLARVPLCGEPQASAGTCGGESLIGHTTVGAGPGSHPFYLGGQVFLTGPYKGAPFGLSIVVPALAGPLNLGTVVVRAAIDVDPHTTALTITSDPLPTILRGIPLRLKSVNVTVDREGFMFNPTSCEPMAIGGSLSSTDGSQAQLSSRFQAGGCSALGFKPRFSASAPAKTSRSGGAALDVKIAYTAGQANIHRVAVKLPAQLPARLTTVQQACPAQVFEANPAGCGEGSRVGIGTALTPVLPVPLTGPAYLVSHGGAAFPDIVIVLQGEGVTVDLVGNILISKSGVTSATFANVPDAPISGFELNLPEGPHSALTAVGSLCSKALAMPTTLTAQNGLQVTQSTKVRVTGCPKAKKAKKHRKRHKARRGGGKKG